jgi:hypothetical protein
MDILHYSVGVIHVVEENILRMTITVISGTTVDETIHTVKETHHRYIDIHCKVHHFGVVYDYIPKMGHPSDLDSEYDALSGERDNHFESKTVGCLELNHQGEHLSWRELGIIGHSNHR